MHNGLPLVRMRGRWCGYTVEDSGRGAKAVGGQRRLWSRRPVISMR